MKNHWLQRKRCHQRWERLEMHTGFTVRKDSEVQEQITCFIEELYKFVDGRPISEIQGDFLWLYNKYPKVRIGIRRAILMVDSIQRSLRSSSA